MEISENILKLAEIAVWPLAFIIAVYALRGSIKGLLARLNKANLKGTVLEFNSDVQKAESIKDNPNIEDLTPHDPFGLIRESEGDISEHLEQLNLASDSEKISLLIKHIADLQLRLAYINTLRIIFGSQYDLLVALNSQAAPVGREFLKSFYDKAKDRYSRVYESYSFEEYLKYLVSNGFVISEKGENRISNFGRAFLTFITENGINISRPY